VLGSINGVNNATASTNVGIGTTTPAYMLHVGNGNNGFRVEGPAPGTKNPISASFGGSGDFAVDAVGTKGGRFVVKDSTGFVGIGNASPAHPLHMGDGAYESGGTWTNSSDRNLKEGFKPVDGDGLLARLSAIPVESWNYKSEGGSIRHLGPMAQDFYAAFGLGQDDKHISTVDEGGVALAAIQQLYRDGLKKDAEIQAQQAQIQAQAVQLKTQQKELKAQQAKGKLQEAQIAGLLLQVKAIQASLKTNGRTGTEIRTVKAQVPLVQQ